MRTQRNNKKLDEKSNFDESEMDDAYSNKNQKGASLKNVSKSRYSKTI
jgi:hypothetical protein